MPFSGVVTPPLTDDECQVLNFEALPYPYVRYGVHREGVAGPLTLYPAAFAAAMTAQPRRLFAHTPRSDVGAAVLPAVEKITASVTDVYPAKFSAVQSPAATLRCDRAAVLLLGLSTDDPEAFRAAFCALPPASRKEIWVLTRRVDRALADSPEVQGFLHTPRSGDVARSLYGLARRVQGRYIFPLLNAVSLPASLRGPVLDAVRDDIPYQF